MTRSYKDNRTCSRLCTWRRVHTQYIHRCTCTRQRIQQYFNILCTRYHVRRPRPTQSCTFTPLTIYSMYTNINRSCIYLQHSVTHAHALSAIFCLCILCGSR